MSSEARRDPRADHLITPENAVNSVVRTEHRGAKPANTLRSVPLEMATHYPTYAA